MFTNASVHSIKTYQVIGILQTYTEHGGRCCTGATAIQPGYIRLVCIRNFCRTEQAGFSLRLSPNNCKQANYGVKEFTVALTTGSNSQTVTGTTAITDIVYTATPICTGSISASASGLPSGVSMVFANNVATISGSANATGTFAYALTFTGASTSQSSNRDDNN